jgi:hypothetical protein
VAATLAEITGDAAEVRGLRGVPRSLMGGLIGGILLAGLLLFLIKGKRRLVTEKPASHQWYHSGYAISRSAG